MCYKFAWQAGRMTCEGIKMCANFAKRLSTSPVWVSSKTSYNSTYCSCRGRAERTRLNRAGLGYGNKVSNLPTSAFHCNSLVWTNQLSLSSSSYLLVTNWKITANNLLSASSIAVFVNETTTANFLVVSWGCLYNNCLLTVLLYNCVTSSE